MVETTRFLGTDPWKDITKHVEKRNREPLICAIAYIGAQATSHLPLRDGDELVCNASVNALRAHATSLDALTTYLSKGVIVHNARDLHAKVTVGSDIAWIGSANASQNSSALLVEAAVRTTEPSVVRQAREFVDALIDQSPTIDLDWVKSMRRHVPARPIVRFPLRGVATAPPPLGLPTATDTIHFVGADYKEESDEDGLEYSRQLPVQKARQRRSGTRARLTSGWWSGRRVAVGQWICWVGVDHVDVPWLVADYTRPGNETWIWGYAPRHAAPQVRRSEIDRVLKQHSVRRGLDENRIVTGAAVAAVSRLFARQPA